MVTTDPGRTREIPTDQALRLLSNVTIGRLVFTRDCMPAIRLVDHAVVDGDVIIRCHDDASVLIAVDQVVAYEADRIDHESHRGWSVIITGKATLVHAPDNAERYDQHVHPWVDATMHNVIRITPELVTAYELH